MKIKKLVILSMFVSLLVVMTYIKIPVYPIVFTLQTFIVILIALIFKPLDTFLIVFTYLLIGFIGIPVFTTGGGPQAFFSPTGGFLIGLLCSSVLISKFKSKRKIFIYDLIVILLFGFILLYAFGIPVLMYTTNMTFINALIAFVPYYVFDIAKILVAYFVYKAIPKEVLIKLET